MYSGADYHHVNLIVTKVSEMQADRNPQQNIRAIVHIKMNKEQAENLVAILRSHIEKHSAGMGPIAFSVEGDFT